MSPAPHLLDRMAPWLMLQRDETLVKLLTMVAVELQHRGMPGAALCFEAARDAIGPRLPLSEQK